MRCGCTKKSDWFAPTTNVNKCIHTFFKQGRNDRTLFFSLLKQGKCTYKKTVERVFVLFLCHPLLHINIDVYAFLRAFGF